MTRLGWDVMVVTAGITLDPNAILNRCDTTPLMASNYNRLEHKTIFIEIGVWGSGIDVQLTDTQERIDISSLLLTGEHVPSF